MFGLLSFPPYFAHPFPVCAANMDVNAIRKKLASLFIPYYICSIFLSVLFFIVKTLPYVCDSLFEDCDLDLVSWCLILVFEG